MTAHHTCDAAARATYAWARRDLPGQKAIVVLHAGDVASALAFGQDVQPTLVSMPALGMQTLSDRFFPEGRLDALSIERAIMDVEDRVMPLHTQLPQPSRLFARNAAITELAHWAGRPDPTAPLWLKTEVVEALFNRWTALALGRPASQDPLPTDGRFSAALLVLRECLHHWGFDGITVLPWVPLESDKSPLTQ